MIVWADTDDDTEEYVGATLAAVAVGVVGGGGGESGRMGRDLHGSKSTGERRGRDGRGDSAQM